MHALIRAVVALLGALAPWGAGHAQSWPERPIRFIVPFAPGGANDQLGRAAAEAVAVGDRGVAADTGE